MSSNGRSIAGLKKLWVLTRVVPDSDVPINRNRYRELVESVL